MPDVNMLRSIKQNCQEENESLAQVAKISSNFLISPAPGPAYVFVTCVCSVECVGRSKEFNKGEGVGAYC